MTTLSRLTPEQIAGLNKRLMTAVLRGDCRDVLKDMPDESVQCVVTSPPYFGLRDYGVDGQIGLENTPAAFVGEMVSVFREVRRVLRSDGVCFLNLGDSYAANRSYQVSQSKHQTHDYGKSNASKVPEGLKPKDLMMIPSRVAITLQEDGWWIRSHIAWTKNNPMPESTKDRPTSSWESIFMLTKSERYYWDVEAAKEPAVGQNPHDLTGGRYKVPGQTKQTGTREAAKETLDGTRNMRNVWNINTKPCKEAHFATFPLAIPERCIKAATSEAGRCPHCGAPWKRIVEKGEPDRAQQLACGGNADGTYTGQAVKDYASGGAQNASDVKRRILEGMRKKETVGWEQTCACPEHFPIPCLVLDPFGGAGTTALAANQMGRDACLIELNPDYIEIIKRRLGREVYDFFIWDLL